MPSRASYLLIIAGKLRGDLVESDIVSQIKKEFAKPKGSGAGAPAAPGENKPYGVGWPNGFVLKNYDLCVWSAEAELYGPDRDQTLFTFRAEIHHSRRGSL